ncbi:MAG: VOC family protein [Akkermansiaceae bacterium]|jgi:catechol 2,3-dioxygenase-like lactoylglutathione lyase family enzyme|nr:VOC family protein [Roseibacillus sp.]
MPDSLLSVCAIDHVAVIAKDLEASRHFYEDLLGMEPVPRPDFPFRGLWFQAGTTQIHVIHKSTEAGPAGMPDFQGTLPSRGTHIAFELESCEVAAAKLINAGIKIVAGPQRRPDGPHQLYIYDPDRYLIELFSMD